MSRSNGNGHSGILFHRDMLIEWLMLRFCWLGLGCPSRSFPFGGLALIRIIGSPYVGKLPCQSRSEYLVARKKGQPGWNAK